MSVKSKLTLTPHPQLNNYVRSNKRFPNYPELFTIGFKGNWLAFVDITDRRKWDYLAHTENIYEGINLLQRSVTLDVMTLEIAIDTLDTELGMFIRKHGCLNKPPRDTAIFHFESNSKKKIDGPSVDGCNEYHGYRPKGWADSRSNAERPEGGRRQIHSYDREVYTGSKVGHSYFRFELRLFRGYLRDYLRRCPVSRPSELIERIQDLAETNLRFRAINLKKLFSERPQSRFWNLQNLSTKGQLYVMRRRGMTKKDICKYIEELSLPPVLFVNDPFPDYDVFPDDGMSLFKETEP